MKKFIFLPAAFTLLLIFQTNALACSCALPIPKLSLKQQINKARKSSDAVFSAKVLLIAKEPQNFYISVKLLVEKSWKAALPDEITITTGLGNGDCGYPFEVGETYLIYASGADKNNLSTNICSRTGNLSAASKDLKILGKGKTFRKNKTQANSAAEFARRSRSVCL